MKTEAVLTNSFKLTPHVPCHWFHCRSDSAKCRRCFCDMSVQVEICTDMSLLRSSSMATF